LLLSSRLPRKEFGPVSGLARIRGRTVFGWPVAGPLPKRFAGEVARSSAAGLWRTSWAGPGFPSVRLVRFRTFFPASPGPSGSGFAPGCRSAVLTQRWQAPLSLRMWCMHPTLPKKGRPAPAQQMSGFHAHGAGNPAERGTGETGRYQPAGSASSTIEPPNSPGHVRQSTAPPESGAPGKVFGTISRQASAVNAPFTPRLQAG